MSNCGNRPHPLLLEKQVQAQFLKSLAASLAFGIVFATVISLFLLPLPGIRPQTPFMVLT